MEISLNELEGRPTPEILRFLANQVTKTEEELQEEKKEQQRKTTDLKIFIAKKEGFELGSVEEGLQELVRNEDTHQYTVDFITEHSFSERRLNEEASLLEVRTPSFDREDHFVLLDAGNYLRVYTTERRHWTKKTVEKVIDYLPGLSRLYLSADDIRGVVDGLGEITETHVSGFTSKYQSYDDERRISIQFHGGDEEDIQDVKDEFNAKPTRVEFRQKNSPTDAVTGAVTRDARVNIPGIRAGSEGLGIETMESVAEEFEALDKAHYSIPNAPEIKSTGGGITIDGFTTLRLGDNGQQPARTDGGQTHGEGAEQSFVDGLKEGILERKQRYDYTEWESEDFLILDKERSETFQLGVDGEDLVLNARPGTTPITLKDFCRVILEEFKSTYEISQRSVSLSE